MKKIINKIFHHPLMSIIIGSIIIVPLTIVLKDYVTKPLLAFIFSEDDSIKVAIQHIVSIIIGKNAEVDHPWPI
ncbi:hypothetical protein HNS38_19875 [Lentimicrobium sp. L6]|uniref:hypothetical protein n=1 Tax=Lentimicrobium sp. L6 TaxID=2735916 RepID=UPI0015558033|nr:hypothetical protein [Lentimicrobium sp. L6]NPD87017.1 hypothetical protein [Lentimicrobium sp. L6]